MPHPTRPSLPKRSASLPPIHLCFGQVDDNHDGRVEIAAVPEENDAPLPWDRLPKEIQQDVLRYALLPSDLGSPALILGKPSHRAHMQNTALPILCGLGNWESYIAAARILYSEVHLVLFLCPNAAMHFLTSPTTLRLRSLVRSLQVHLNIENDLCLFDEGWRSTASVPEARVNIPTALHSMHIHGCLHKVHFLLNVPEIMYHHGPDSANGIMRNNPAYYLPLARLQLAHWDAAVWDTPASCSETACHPGRELIAPAFLAGRAFQYGFLPLLEESVMWNTIMSLEVISKDGRSRVERTDAGKLFKYWLGATILEVLSETKAIRIARGKWVDPFAIARRAPSGVKAAVLQQGEADGDHEPAMRLDDGDREHELSDANMPETEAYPDATHLPTHRERIGYKSRGDDLLLSSPIRYISPTPSSVSSTEDVKMDLGAYIHVAKTGGELEGECEVDQDSRTEDNPQSDDSDDEDELFSSCLGSTISHAVAQKIIESVEPPAMRGKLLDSKLPRSEVDFDSDSSDGPVETLRATQRLGYGKAAAVESAGRENSAPPSFDASSHTDSDASSSDEDKMSGEERTPMAKLLDSMRADKGEGVSLKEGREQTATLPVEGKNRDRSTSTNSSSLTHTPAPSMPQEESTQTIPPMLTPTTAFRPVKPAFISASGPSPPGQAAPKISQDTATTGMKRKAPHDGAETAKMSRNARRRANRRARLLARVVEESVEGV